ncbi:MAG TPA: phospholipase D-like domain-containing protein [Candidatus Obscuribacterales bacterium]
MKLDRLTLSSAIKECSSRRPIVHPSDKSISNLVSEITSVYSKGEHTLAKVLSAAIFEAANLTHEVSLAVTGMAWLGAGVSSVEQRLLDLISTANQRILLCCYRISTGAIPLLDALAEASRQGVSTTLVCDSFNKQPRIIQDYLRQNAARFGDKFAVYDFMETDEYTALHAKVVVVDQHTALIGSANLSFHGMVANHEMAVVVSGPIAAEISSRIDMLLKSALVQRIT